MTEKSPEDMNPEEIDNAIAQFHALQRLRVMIKEMLDLGVRVRALYTECPELENKVDIRMFFQSPPEDWIDGVEDWINK